MRVRKVDKMAQEQRKYEKEYKVQAVKLAKEIGAGKAAKELGIPVDTLYGWQKAVREGRLDAVMSRIMRKIVCRLWQNKISQQ